MRLVRVLATFEAARDVESLHDEPTPRRSCSNADTAIVLGSLRDRLSREVGVWLERLGGLLGPDCGARRAHTVVLMDLRHVVVEAPEPAVEHAEVVRALLSG